MKALYSLLFMTVQNLLFSKDSLRITYVTVFFNLLVHILLVSVIGTDLFYYATVRSTNHVV